MRWREGSRSRMHGMKQVRLSAVLKVRRIFFFEIEIGHKYHLVRLRGEIIKYDM